MKIFSCSVCGHVLFFENVCCLRCGTALAYLQERGVLSGIKPVEQESKTPDAASPVTPVIYTAVAPSADGASVKLCQNSVEHGVCNWALPAEDEHSYCRACRLNAVIPNLTQPGAKTAWQRLEQAKRRLLYTLFGLGLSVEPPDGASEGGLVFAFLQELPGGDKPSTGHASGRITIDIAEADDAHREKVRSELREPYRTLLGHFRHEVAHYYWDRLLRGTAHIDAFREEFGDEQADYSESLARHYASGPTAEWPETFVSAYASAHPWEDWAETWAHYLHMVDTIETARAFGLALRPKPEDGATPPSLVVRRLDVDGFDDLVAAWVPLTIALNSINRSMGLSDLYPFALSPRVVRKLKFVHDVIERAGATHAKQA